MNYDYNVRNADASGAFMKRALIYAAILGVTIALALTILFILFEIYIWLILSLGIMALSVIVMILLGRKGSVFHYAIFDDLLIVTVGNGKEYRFERVELTLERNAEKSDFVSKDIKVLTFPQGWIATKNTTNENRSEDVSFLVRYREDMYLLALDDYIRSLLFKEKNEDTLL